MEAVGIERNNQQLPNEIVIDSPYMMVLTDKNLGTVLGMAFIANPESD
jgi:serine protease inhibitor